MYMFSRFSIALYHFNVRPNIKLVILEILLNGWSHNNGQLKKSNNYLVIIVIDSADQKMIITAKFLIYIIM
jgi:hypothetical protein